MVGPSLTAQQSISLFLNLGFPELAHTCPKQHSNIPHKPSRITGRVNPYLI